MQITNCKLSKRFQKKLLEFFVLQVTARSAADILGIHPNSAALFYRKIRMVISHWTRPCAPVQKGRASRENFLRMFMDVCWYK